MRFGISSLFLLAFAVPASAGDTIDMSSVGKGMSKSVVHPISEGHMIMDITSEYSGFESTSTDSPAAGSSGDCFGSVQVKGASATGGGYCKFADSDGDNWMSSWTVSGLTQDGALVGTWAILGGQGKYTGASGGGQFHSLTDTTTGAFENKITGAMIMP